MRALALVSAPFVHLLSASTDAVLNLLLKMLRIRPHDSAAQPLSPEEIREDALHVNVLDYIGLNHAGLKAVDRRVSRLELRT